MSKRILLSTVLFLSFSFNLSAIDPEDTRLMHSPTVSANHVAFIYAEDLWVANLDGTSPRRLTVDEGVESNPVFSPDGSTIAFSAEYDGNTDVFVVPVTGGIPKRLTYHPYTDAVRDFTPDGKKVLFISQREVFTNRYAQFFTVNVNGGNITKLKIPYGNKGSYNDEGTHIAYNPVREVFDQWKNYRGGTMSRIWLFSMSDNSVVEIPKPEGGSNDTDPQWMGSKVYFRSDRNGEFNLYSYDVGSKSVNQLTDFNDFPVLSLSANAGKLMFEQAGYIHQMDVSSGDVKKVKIGIATDLLELRPRYVKGNNYIRSAHISPSGARAVFDFRGDIITAPAEKGDPDNITLTQGAHETAPTWSQDGKHIAYFSDASGEYALHLKTKGVEKPRSIKLNGTGFYNFINWSPDSKKLAYVDNGRNLYVMNVESGKSTKIAQDQYYYPGPYRNLFGSWSHDSKWISYTKIIDNQFEQAFLYDVSSNKSYELSDGLSNVTSPVFDPSGKYVYMMASTDAGPVVNWFQQSNQDMEMSNSIYLVTLKKETPSPLAKENDVEAADKEEEEKKEDKPDVSIDWDGITSRIIDIPISAGMYYNLSAPAEGEIYYLSSDPHAGKVMLHKYSLQERKEEPLMPVNDYMISADCKKMLYNASGSWSIGPLGKAADKPINTGAIQVKIDPQDEWPNIFNEAWRVNRDYFYDPGMHGADWDAMKVKYSTFISEVSCRSDLYRVMQWMCSELAVGHHRFTNRGDRMADPESVPGGLLGADYKVSNGRYQIDKIYGGLNWNPSLRSPLTEPGVNVNVGDYLLAVNGKDVSSSDNLYMFFENTANKITSITVGPNAGYKDSREVNVVPLSSEYALRNRDWVEGNLKKVDEATDGQVAYVYVPNTAGAGHEYFKRYFFPQAHKKAIIIDERFNGGGQIADYYIELLTRPYQSHWNFRYGKDLKTPFATIQGPKVMLIDENAGSGGDMLPWMFRKFNVGTMIGKTTWGGLVGILGFPSFIDGGSVTAPNLAIWTEEGFIVENRGVAPDIEVEQWPKDLIEGNDPQLQKAIEVALEQLEENPPKEYKRPDYPVRVKDNE